MSETVHTVLYRGKCPSVTVKANPSAPVSVKELYRALEARIPFGLGCEWDHDGLSCCPDPTAAVTGILVSLDVNPLSVGEAEKHGCNVILTHHPLLFRGLQAVDGESGSSALVIRLIRNGLSAMAFHTRLDAVQGGVNDVLAARLGLTDCHPFGDPECRDSSFRQPMGRIGFLSETLSLDDFAGRVKTALNAPAVLSASAGKPVHCVAVLGGSGADFVASAARAGADTFVTGEIGYHRLSDAPDSGVNVIAAGHYHTENPVCERLSALAAEICPDCPVFLCASPRIAVM